MRIQLHRFEYNRVRNVNGKVMSSSHGYVIVVRRWFKKKRYLRLLPGWFESFQKGETCKVELTRRRGQATEFRDGTNTANYLQKSVADKLVAAIKKDPDKFMLG